MNRDQAISVANDSLLEGNLSDWYKQVKEGSYSKKIQNKGYHEG